MQTLSSLLTKGAKLFSEHHYQEALAVYEKSIERAKKTDEPAALTLSLKTTQAALIGILGDSSKALTILKQIIEEDRYHYLALMRRSEIYKRINKPKKALKDIETLSQFYPDNLQLTAIRMGLMAIIKGISQGVIDDDITSEESASEDEEEEHIKLNFTNLKTIDRKSITLQPAQGRKSRVTISGDIAYHYETQENSDSTNLTKEMLNDKWKKASEELAENDSDLEIESKKGDSNCSEQPNKGETSQPKPKAHKSLELHRQVRISQTLSQKPMGKHSILKNKNSIIYKNEDLPKVRASICKRSSKIIDNLKDIEGKIIKAGDNIEEDTEAKDNVPQVPTQHKPRRTVEFRKSISGLQDIIGGAENKQHITSSLRPNSNFGQMSAGMSPDVAFTASFPLNIGRKSCLKRPSFQAGKNPLIDVTAKSPHRRSKFDSITLKGIDGVIPLPGYVRQDPRSSLNQVKIIEKDSSEDQTDHNIYGSTKAVLSPTMKRKLGISSDSDSDDNQNNNVTPKKALENVVTQIVKKQRTTAKSILKRNSIFDKQSTPAAKKQLKVEDSPAPTSERKSKKSVMFSE